jgi:hypothetical protein
MAARYAELSIWNVTLMVLLIGCIYWKTNMHYALGDKHE